MKKRSQAHTDLLLIFLFESIELLRELLGLVFPQCSGVDQVPFKLLHLEA